MNKKLGLWLVTGVLATTSYASVIFEYTYNDVGVGFNDATYGTQRRAALANAGSYVSGLFVNYNATIQIDVQSVSDPAFLAAAGSSYNSSFPGTGFGDRGDVMIKILGGTDPNSSAADGSIDWNFTNYQWELGNDFQDGEFDFFSTAVHELLHTVGFLSEIDEDGSSGWGQAAGTATAWSPFDEHVADRDGYLINGSYALESDAWNTASVGGAGENGLMFVGENAMAANGGNPVYLYSPETWDSGSSGSHIDDAIYHGTYIMEASTTDGLGIREVSEVELGMFKDIGYTEIIPEPTSLALIGLAGFSVLISRRFPMFLRLK